MQEVRARTCGSGCYGTWEVVIKHGEEEVFSHRINAGHPLAPSLAGVVESVNAVAKERYEARTKTCTKNENNEGKDDKYREKKDYKKEYHQKHMNAA